MSQTPSGERVHIGFFGKRNAGKSSLMNAVTGQAAALVSPVKGTTTDPVRKAMELLPAGPVLMIDTPGFDDEGELGSQRVRKARQALNQTDVAVLVVDAAQGADGTDLALIRLFREKGMRYIVAHNKSDLLAGGVPPASAPQAGDPRAATGAVAKAAARAGAQPSGERAADHQAASARGGDPRAAAGARAADQRAESAQGASAQAKSGQDAGRQASAQPGGAPAGGGLLGGAEAAPRSGSACGASSGSGAAPSTGASSGSGAAPSVAPNSGLGTAPSTGASSGSGAAPSVAPNSGFGTAPSTGASSGSGAEEIYVSAATGLNVAALKEKIAALAVADEPRLRVIGDLIRPSDFVVLVTPIDKAAPKGRLILPQQQVIRDILEADAIAVVVKEHELRDALGRLGGPPAMVVTDSQVFAKAAADTPPGVPLTSFSILMARYKGCLDAAVRGAKALDALEDGDRVLVCEGCAHHRQCDDIGTVKLPRWIRQYTGKSPDFEFASGADFPDDLSPYKLAVHCGGCMLNAREVRRRSASAEEQGVPITNYGVAIAHMQGILARCLSAFPHLLADLE
jgi:small GTP-binding protein